tara:strand:- start:25 stop:870 length:846 start_codon:yes stop_codon:yes gene_type:complete
MADEKKTGKSKIKLKKPTLGGMLSRIVKRVATDIKPLPGRTITGKRKTLSKRDNPEVKSGIAKREDSIQLKDGTIKTMPEGYKLKDGEKIVSISKKTRKKTVPDTKIKGGTIQSSTVKSQKNLDSQVTKRDIRRFGTRAAAVAALSGAGKGIYDAVKGPKLAGASNTSSSGGGYKVKSGDTLSQIAKREGTTLAALLKANGIAPKDANKLSIGQKLKLPSKVKDRKSVYQDMKKSEMKKMAMPKKKKMGGKVVKRNKGGAVRGTGAATRGFGKGPYSNKPY